MMRIALQNWRPRNWIVAAVVTVLGILAVAVPTALIATPWFTRQIPPEWWAWPALVVSAVLGGLLVATYVAPSVAQDEDESGDPATADAVDRPARRGVVGGVLTFFAVGCPVCNKLVLVALGSAGAITWFQPFQPILQVGAVALLVWALRTRLVNQVSCRLPRPTADVI